jgi:hypothetical protein
VIKYHDGYVKVIISFLLNGDVELKLLL